MRNCFYSNRGITFSSIFWYCYWIYFPYRSSFSLSHIDENEQILLSLYCQSRISEKWNQSLSPSLDVIKFFRPPRPALITKGTPITSSAFRCYQPTIDKLQLFCRSKPLVSVDGMLVMKLKRFLCVKWKWSTWSSNIFV